MSSVSSLTQRCKNWLRWVIVFLVFQVALDLIIHCLVGNIPDMAMKTIELIEDFYENTMGVPTHICQYNVSQDHAWIEQVVKKSL